jgi:hypothetical protein
MAMRSVLATCDSADVLYEKRPYDLPISIEIGDKVLIEGTGVARSSAWDSVTVASNHGRVCGLACP